MTTPTALFGELFRTSPAPADPYPLYEQLRAAGPMVRVGPDSWLTTSHDLSLQVLRDPQFGNDAEQAGAARGGPDWGERPCLRTLAGMLLMANPPRHTELRGLLTTHFRRNPVAAVRAGVEVQVSRLVQDLVDAGEVDFVPAFADVLPNLVISDFIGIPAADRLRFREHTLAFNAVFERDLSPAQLAAADIAAVEIDGYVRSLVHEARRSPRGDLISTLVECCDATGLPVEELVRLVFQVYNASYQTVLGLLGNGLTALLEHPGQYAALRADPGLVPASVAEMLRYDPPVQTTGRHASADVRVGDAQVRAGELVITVLAAANRDPARYSDPARFDITRTVRSSVAFGFGIHYCLGAALAVLQGEAAFTALADRDLAVTPAGPSRLHGGSNMRSRQNVPIRVRAGGGHR